MSELFIFFSKVILCYVTGLFSETKQDSRDEKSDGFKDTASGSQDKKNTDFIGEQRKPMGRLSGDGAEKAAVGAVAVAVAVNSAAGPPTKRTEDESEFSRGGSLPKRSTTAVTGKPVDWTMTTAAAAGTTVQQEKPERPGPVEDDTVSADTAAVAGSNSNGESAETEYRLTMIQSVREAVNKICEQAVEKTQAMVRSGIKRPDGQEVDVSEVADYSSSDFSLPPAPTPGGRSSASVDPVSVRSTFCRPAANIWMCNVSFVLIICYCRSGVSGGGGGRVGCIKSKSRYIPRLGPVAVSDSFGILPFVEN